MRGVASIKVERPIEEVWKFISNPDNMDRWVDGFSEPNVQSEGELAQGSKFSIKYKFDNKTYPVSALLTAFDPPKRFSYRISGGPHPAFNELNLKSQGNATSIRHVYEMDVSQQTVGAVFLGLGPMVRLQIMFRLRKDLKKVKKFLEANQDILAS